MEKSLTVKDEEITEESLRKMAAVSGGYKAVDDIKFELSYFCVLKISEMKYLLFILPAFGNLGDEVAKGAGDAGTLAAAAFGTMEKRGFQLAHAGAGSVGVVTQLSESVVKHALNTVVGKGVANGIDRADGRILYYEGMLSMGRIKTHLDECEQKFKDLPDKLSYALQRIVMAHQSMGITPGTAVKDAIPLYDKVKTELDEFKEFFKKYDTEVNVALRGEAAAVAAAEVQLEAKEAADRRVALQAAIVKHEARAKLVLHVATAGLV